jgi:hypothetical protein
MRGCTSYGVPTGFLDLPPEATVSPHLGELDLPLGVTAREQVRAIVRQEMAAPHWTVRRPLTPETVMPEKKDQPQQTQPKPGAAPSPPPPPQPPQAGQQSQHTPGQQPQPGQTQPQGGQAQQQQPPPGQGGEGPMSQVDWGRVQHAVATVTEHLPEFPEVLTKLADTFRSRPQPTRAAESDAGVDHAGAVDAQTDHILNLLALHLHHKALVRAEAEAAKEE